MNLPSVLVAHGEKLLVALVAVLCVLSVWMTASDPGIRPAVSPIQMKDVDFARIAEAEANAGKPVFMPAPDLPGQLLTRLSTRPQAEPLAQWLVRHPDLVESGSGTSGPVYPLVFELGIPEIAVEDKVGRIEIAAALPEPKRANGADDRVVDGPQQAWERRTPRPVRNTAAWAGVLFEYYKVDDVNRGKDDKATWLPLASATAPKGVAPLGAGGTAVNVVLAPVEEWEKYRFRARLVGAASAPAAGGRVVQEKEVLVYKRPLAQVPAISDQAAYERLADLWATSPDAADRLDDGRFVGLPSKVREVLTGSMVRICLERIRAGGAGPDGAVVPDKAKLLLRKQITNPDGTPLGWTDAWAQEVAVGDKVGQDQVVLPKVGTPTEKDRYDLRTPFELIEIRRDVDRVLYQEVRKKADEAKPDEKRLTITPKTKKVDVVRLKNAKSGAVIELVEATKATQPAENPQVGIFLFPLFPGGAFDEMGAFKTKPDEFAPAALDQPKPVLHTTTDRLKGLVADKSLIDAELPYVEMPEVDGRIIYYDRLNRRWIVLQTRKREEPKPEVRPADAGEAKPEVPPGDAAAKPDEKPAVAPRTPTR